MKAQHKRSALNRLKTVRGHLDAVIAMVDDERYCPQVMKQVSALQSSLERMDMVTREDYEIQVALVARLRSRLDALEARVVALESGATGPADTREG